MRNLFEISSEEKQRILEMHVDATKKLYLNEQSELSPTPTYSSVVIKGADLHTPQSLEKVNEMGIKKFGKNNFEILQTNTGYIVANNKVYQDMRNLYQEIYSSPSIENNDPVLGYDRVNNKITKLIEMPGTQGSRTEYVSGEGPLYDYMKKHLFNSKGNSSTLGARISFNRGMIKDFFKDPKNKFGDLCYILNPRSIFMRDGFPGIDVSCKLGDKYVWEKFNPNDYIRVDGKSYGKS